MTTPALIAAARAVAEAFQYNEHVDAQVIETYHATNLQLALAAIPPDPVIVPAALIEGVATWMEREMHAIAGRNSRYGLTPGPNEYDLVGRLRALLPITKDRA